MLFNARYFYNRNVVLLDADSCSGTAYCVFKAKQIGVGALTDIINQTRLAMRLDRYLEKRAETHGRKNIATEGEWNTAWDAADDARMHKNLTPELVDDVRIVLHKF